MKHLKIHPLLFVVIGISILTNQFQPFIITYLSLLCHELIHLFFLCRKKVLLHRIVLEPFGICIETENDPPASTVVYLSAPIFNLLVVFFLYIGYKNNLIPLYLDWLFANLFLGVLNLLPCLPLDGGRALFCILKKYTNEKKAQKTVKAFSLVFSLLLCSAGTLLLYQTDNNPSLLMIGIFLCYTCFTDNRFTVSKSICKAFERIGHTLSETALPVITLAAEVDYPARKLISQFREDCYYTITLISHGKIIKTLTETQVLETILASDSDILLWECG